MSFPAARVTGLCPSLSPTQARAVLGHLGLKAGEDFDPGQALVAWLYDLLAGLRLLEEEALWRVVEAYDGRVREYGALLEGALGSGKSEVPVMVLGFADRRHAMVQGDDAFLDVSTGERVPRARVQFLEVLAYNLATLYVRKRLECLAKVKEVSGAPLPQPGGDV